MDRAHGGNDGAWIGGRERPRRQCGGVRARSHFEGFPVPKYAPLLNSTHSRRICIHLTPKVQPAAPRHCDGRQ
jgi:hypothetical protein